MNQFDTGYCDRIQCFSLNAEERSDFGNKICHRKTNIAETSFSNFPPFKTHREETKFFEDQWC